MSIHHQFMRECFAIARAAARQGYEPFGALLVADGTILLKARNTVVKSGDRTSHAELNLVGAAARELDSETIARSTLYTSTEPCAMCAGAIYWSGIPEVVYGCPARSLGAIAGGSLVIPCRLIFSEGKRTVRVIGPVLEQEALEVHRGHWHTEGAAGRASGYNPVKGETR